MRKRKRTGAMMWHCWTPTVCGISTTSFSIFSTAILSLYIVLIAATIFGGAPYCSRMHRSSVWFAVSYALTRSTNPTYNVRSWFWHAFISAFRVNSPSLHHTSGVPPNLNLVPCFSRRRTAQVLRTELKTLLHMSISMMPRHLFESLRSPFFGTGMHWLLCHPLWSIFPLKKSKTCLWSICCGVSFIAFSASGGMPLSPGLFPFFSLLMAALTSLNVMGVSMALRRGFCWMRPWTVVSTGLWLLTA